MQIAENNGHVKEEAKGKQICKAGSLTNNESKMMWKEEKTHGKPQLR
jgi:hypothetical protein